MKAARLSGFFRWLTSGTALVLVTLALLIDAMLLPTASTCRLRPRPRVGPFDPSPYSLTRVNGVLHATAEYPGEAVGSVNAFIRLDDAACFWAPTSQVVSVFLSPHMTLDADPTPAELMAIGADIAAHRESLGIDDHANTLLRLGGGLSMRTLPGGYIHNAAAMLAVLLLSCGLIRQGHDLLKMRRLRKRRRRNQCPYCGYPRTSDSFAKCPECGRTPE
jgi:hypothetical protein